MVSLTKILELNKPLKEAIQALERFERLYYEKHTIEYWNAFTGDFGSLETFNIKQENVFDRYILRYYGGLK